MSTITHLSAIGLKGETFDLDFAPLNLIVGTNFSGKTARLDALRLVMLGFHPRLPRTAQGIFKLASAERMEVRASFSDGQSVVRAWSQDKRGTVSYSGPKEALVPSVLMDARSYLELPAKDKVRYVAARVDLTQFGYSDARLLELLKDIPRSSRQDAELAKIISQIKTTLGAKVLSVTETLEALCERFREQERQAKQDAAAATGLIATQAAVPAPMTTESVEALEAQRKAIQDQLRFLHPEEATLQVVDQPRANDALYLERVKINTQRKAVEEQIEKQMDIWHADAKEAEATLAKEVCPFCGSDDQSWKKAFKRKHNAQQKLLQHQIDTLIRQGKDLIGRAEAISEKISKAEEQIVSASIAAKEQTQERLREIADQERSLKDQLADLDTRYRTAVAAAHDRTRREQARQRAEQAQDMAELTKAVLRVIESEMKALTDRVLEHIVTLTRPFTEGLLSANLDYRDGEFGYQAESVWISHSTFSGAETAIAFSALSVALAQESPWKGVLLDELGVLDHERRAGLVERLQKLIADKVIDQAIISDTTDSWLSERLRNTVKILAL